MSRGCTPPPSRPWCLYLSTTTRTALTPAPPLLRAALAEQRAKGELPTLAKWTRDFVAAHVDYDQDSVVSPVVATDLLQAYVEIAEGRRQEPALLGEHVVMPLSES